MKGTGMRSRQDALGGSGRMQKGPGYRRQVQQLVMAEGAAAEAAARAATGGGETGDAAANEALATKWWLY